MMIETSLPEWKHVLAVVAHPDDESFGLGAVLSTQIASGGEVSVLCLTHGEASTLHGVAGDLSAIREKELAAAAAELGIKNVDLRDFPDGRLSSIPIDELLQVATSVARLRRPDGILAFDVAGVTGHPDHITATALASRLADELDVGLLAWTLSREVAEALNREFTSSFVGVEVADIDFEVSVDRTRQRRAVGCHPSQAVPGAILWRRMELQADKEHLRWLRSPPSR